MKDARYVVLWALLLVRGHCVRVRDVKSRVIVCRLLVVKRGPDVGRRGQAWALGGTAGQGPGEHSGRGFGHGHGWSFVGGGKAGR